MGSKKQENREQVTKGVRGGQGREKKREKEGKKRQRNKGKG